MAISFDVNLSILFTEIPLLERPAAAAAAGFSAVELWWPFATPVPADGDLDALQRAIQDAGVRLVGLNFDAGDMARGERGLLSRPAQSDRFVANIDVAVGFAERLGCTILNALYGNRDADADPVRQDELAAENLAKAASAAARTGATVVVEALNSYESPHYPITSSRGAIAVIDRVRKESGVDNISFLADFYHLHRMGEEPLELVDRLSARFGHVQIADVPGRGQPGTGTIPYGEVLGRLEKSGYAGQVGLEYKPVGPSAASFGWLKEIAS
ncbi:hydroxypyruvate isomerase family protein [Fodinicola acaciae]|uniref:hydroxypyruvate isomerase family protein n=1 Tax=Fodinicola acaciae TaxID=2681555 RepID=UPI0013D1415A|nr:TIM barrel protein [Fodinicola acaciae]